MAGSTYFYSDASNEFRWRAVAANGREIGSASEGYKNFKDCMENYKETLRKHIDEAEMYLESPHGMRILKYGDDVVLTESIKRDRPYPEDMTE
jgi:uncharacterized protein YegP (UPF0339 family)